MNLEEYARMYEAEERQWWYAGMRAISAALLDKHLARGDGRLRILDAGCGTGNNLAHFRGRGRAVGVDLSEDALRFCRSRGVQAARGNVLALPFGARAFDLVTSFDVLYHRWVADDAAAVAELARVLAPGGLLLVRVPALKMLWGAHDDAVHSRHRYTRGEVEALLRGAGLDVLELTYANTLLFPVLALRRAIDRWTGRHGSDVSFLPAPIESAFRGLLLVRVPALKMLWGAHDDAVHSRHRYTRGEVEALLRGAGLDVLELTYANTLLFPVLALRRTIDRWTGRHGSDVSFLPAPIESAFRGLLRAEARMVRHVRLPIGASVLALGRKPGENGASGTIAR